MTEAQPLSWKTKLGWAIGELGVAIYVGGTMSFFLFYLTEAHGISPAWAGVALLVPRIWDGLTDPLMGTISDRTRSKHGRRRPYLFIGSLAYGASFYLVLSIPDMGSKDTTLIYLVGAYMVASTAITIFDVPYSSMAAEMTQSYRDRTSLAGYKMVAARLGILFAGGTGPLLYNSKDNLLDGFSQMGLVFGVVMTLTGLVTFFATKNAPRIEAPVKSFSIKQEFSALWSNRPFRILFSAFLFQNIAIGSSATMLVYFLTFAMLIDASLIGPLLMVAGITSTLVTPVWVVIARRLGKRETYLLGLSIATVMAIPALFLPAEYYYLLFAVYFFAAIADAVNQLMPTSMVPDTVEADEVRTGDRREGVIFGAMAFCRKLGMAFGAFFASWILQLAGFVGGGITPAMQTESGVLGIRIAYTLLPSLLWIGALIVIRQYSLSESRFDAIKAEIWGRSKVPE
jgi:glycoside/pentoside/hexuronide:cation symporter, GPH family